MAQGSEVTCPRSHSLGGEQGSKPGSLRLFPRPGPCPSTKTPFPQVSRVSTFGVSWVPAYSGAQNTWVLRAEPISKTTASSGCLPSQMVWGGRNSLVVTCLPSTACGLHIRAALPRHTPSAKPTCPRPQGGWRLDHTARGGMIKFLDCGVHKVG